MTRHFPGSARVSGIQIQRGGGPANLTSFVIVASTPPPNAQPITKAEKTYTDDHHNLNAQEQSPQIPPAGILCGEAQKQNNEFDGLSFIMVADARSSAIARRNHVAVRASPSTLLKCSMRATCQVIFSLSWFLYDLLLIFALV